MSTILIRPLLCPTPSKFSHGFSIPLLNSTSFSSRASFQCRCSKHQGTQKGTEVLLLLLLQFSYNLNDLQLDCIELNTDSWYFCPYVWLFFVGFVQFCWYKLQKLYLWCVKLIFVLYYVNGWFFVINGLLGELKR